MQVATATAPAQAGIQRREPPIVKHLGVVPYIPIYEAMRRFTETRGPATRDELWVLEHPPVYTVGVAGRQEHFPSRTEIPIERIDRGGRSPITDRAGDRMCSSILRGAA
jgi:lipoate-protein ligase B